MARRLVDAQEIRDLDEALIAAYRMHRELRVRYPIADRISRPGVGGGMTATFALSVPDDPALLARSRRQSSSRATRPSPLVAARPPSWHSSRKPAR